MSGYSYPQVKLGALSKCPAPFLLWRPLLHNTVLTHPLMLVWAFEPDGGCEDVLLSSATLWNGTLLVEALRVAGDDDPTPMSSVRDRFGRWVRAAGRGHRLTTTRLPGRGGSPGESRNALKSLVSRAGPEPTAPTLEVRPAHRANGLNRCFSDPLLTLSRR